MIQTEEGDGDAGHNYGDTEKSGFVKVLVKRDGRPLLVENPKRRKKP